MIISSGDLGFRIKRKSYKNIRMAKNSHKILNIPGSFLVRAGLDIFAKSSQVELEKLAKLENTKEKQTAKA